MKGSESSRPPLGLESLNQPLRLQLAPTAVRDVVPAERKHVAIKVGRSSSRDAASEVSEKPVKRATPAPRAPAPVEPSVVKPEEQGQAGQSDAAAAETTKPASLGSRIKNRMGARKGGGSGSEPVAPCGAIQLSPVER